MVSIIIPCYNQAQYLTEAVDSVRQQTYADWECIIVNDGSPDNTREIALALCERDPRIRYVEKENGGLASARNAGIAVAEGEFVLPLDSDDKIHPLYLEKAMEAFGANPSLKLVYCDAEKFGFENGKWELPPYDYKELLRSNMIFCSALFRTTDCMAAGGYDEELNRGWEDWAFWVKLLDFDAEVYKVPLTLFYYRTKEMSMVKSIDPQYAEKIRWFIFRENISKYQKVFLSPMNVLDENIYLKEEVARILQSHSYRFGNLLLRPFSSIKAFLNKRMNNGS